MKNSREGLFPHPSNVVYPMSPTTPYLPLPDNSQYPSQMDYFGDYASLYPTSSAREESNTCQPPDQTLATGGADDQLYNYTFTDLRNMPEQSGSVVDELTNLLAATSCESLAPAASYVNQADGYGQPSYSNSYWPDVDQVAQSYHFDSLNQEFSFNNTVVSEPPTVIPAPSSAPFNYWGENQGGPSTSTFHTNVYTYHQPGTRPTRAGMTSMGRFQPYERPHARRNKYRNAEAGPSTLIPASFPYVGYPTLQPSGGMISETTADAEQKQKTTEEDKAPAEPKRTKCPRGEGPPRRHRLRMRGYTTRLLNWAQHRLELRESPILNDALTAAVAVIEDIRVPVYSGSQLLRGESTPKTDSKTAITERNRREVERDLYGKLSRYYLLRPSQGAWTRPPLLLRVLKDLESRNTPPGPSDQPPP